MHASKVPHIQSSYRVIRLRPVFGVIESAGLNNARRPVWRGAVACGPSQARRLADIKVPRRPKRALGALQATHSRANGSLHRQRNDSGTPLSIAEISAKTEKILRSKALANIERLS
jgi:hypothetical protein